MKFPLKWLLAGVVLALLAAGVWRALAGREAARQTLESQQAAARQEARMELSPQDLVRAQTRELTQVLPLSGALRAVNSALVKARVAGELQGLSVREGDSVQAGQVLARIDSTEYQARVRQAQQQAESAKAQVDLAQRTLDNNRALVEQGFISRTALDNALNNLAAAQASYRAAQAATDVAAKALQDTVLRAPIAGQIAQRLVQNGERVGIDARVVEIVDLRALELEAALGAADSVQVRTGQSAQLSVEGLPEPLQARVVRINPSAVAGSRAVLVYLALQPGAGLRQGLFAQGRLNLGTVRALAVPRDAVRTDKPQPYVQVLRDGRVAHQPVQLGVAGDYQGLPMQAVQGLAEGAAVLAGTVGALREGTLISTVANPAAADTPAAGTP